jgi:hypothetical protein
MDDIIVNQNNVSEGTQRERDVIVGQDDNKANVLLRDLILLHRLLWRVQDKEAPKGIEDVSDLVSRLFKLMEGGRKYDLAGLKDVPTPFLVGKARFINGGKELDESEATQFVAQMILEVFGQASTEIDQNPFKDKLSKFIGLPGHSEPSSNPQVVDAADIQDVILLRCDVPQDEEKNYEHQNGNKNFFRLASQYVTADSNDPLKRLESTLLVLDGDAPINDPQPRFLSQDAKAVWSTVDRTEVAEFAVIFTYEVFLEKQMNGAYDDLKIDEKSQQDTAKPSSVPIENPNSHDVLFGRGGKLEDWTPYADFRLLMRNQCRCLPCIIGMTNNHPGNRRFRDIIALHRPDYIRAVKIDKPNVARKIVRAIRCGNPPGR